MHHTVAGRPNVPCSSLTVNWKYALQFEIQCLQRVWMGWSPSRKLMNAIGKRFWKPRHIALSDQTGSNQDVRQAAVCWKILFSRQKKRCLGADVQPSFLHNPTPNHAAPNTPSPQPSRQDHTVASARRHICPGTSAATIATACHGRHARTGTGSSASWTSQGPKAAWRRSNGG